ncbi:trypsin delta-like [Anopheles albimanus]|uniref:trypsin delta-like n=1 Tax=Anopheles albimanus TaxID=7167 RepID=UPI00163FAEBD|nr:trypsin delta-like [Anopheles albimanus]
MQQSVKLFLLALLFCAYCTKAQDGDAADPESDQDSTSISVEILGNGTNQADRDRAGRINKGVVFGIGSYPFLATVIKTSLNGSVSYSAGVIISNTHVLTAYTIVATGTVITIRAGSSYQDREGTVFQTQNYINHNQYSNATLANDLAIITIQGTFAGVQKVEPIPMQTTELDPSSPNLANCYLFGWKIPSDYLRRAEVKLITDATCSNQTPSVQCTQSITTSFGCDGDGGSPLVCDDLLYGLYIEGVCDPNASQAINKFAKIPAASIQSFLSPILNPPRKNYMTCPCVTC